MNCFRDPWDLRNCFRETVETRVETVSACFLATILVDSSPMLGVTGHDVTVLTDLVDPNLYFWHKHQKYLQYLGYSWHQNYFH